MKLSSSPWGTPDNQHELAAGIISLDTSSHGGIWISAVRRAAMPAALRQIETFAGGNWYEEDCDWAIVALAFPDAFTPRDIAVARQTFDSYHAPKAAAA